MSLPIVYHPDYVTPLPDAHRFPMPKFRLLYELLLSDGVADLNQFHTPEKPNQSTIELVHTKEFVNGYLNGTLDTKAQRRIGLPWSPQLVNRTCTAVGGTILAAKLALNKGLACNTAGGTHHAFPSYGSGFCIFNDFAIATR
ncbi:MAG: histone deacetylase, partial [Cyanobacteria bacterium J06573_2]